MNGRMHPGAEAIDAKGGLRAHKWLLLRRVSQVGILALFLAGPWAGFWIVKGNLSSSVTLGVLPLTDPFVALQSLAAGHIAEIEVLIGVLIVVGFYLLVGGRTFCAWVCPLNMVTDLAAWLRERLAIKGSARITRATRYWLLGTVLLLSLISGTLVWEWVNPVSMLQRGLIFGMGLAWLVILAVFLFDLFVSRQGWCGHICPMGAFYSLLGKPALIRVKACRREKCNDCMDCFAVCPEPQVIRPALKGAAAGVSPVINNVNCTNCGRCIDVCAKDVFKFGIRVQRETGVHFTATKMEVTS